MYKNVLCLLINTPYSYNWVHEKVRKIKIFKNFVPLLVLNQVRRITEMMFRIHAKRPSESQKRENQSVRNLTKKFAKRHFRKCKNRNEKTRF